jgi:hypothetical protein
VLQYITKLADGGFFDIYKNSYIGFNLKLLSRICNVQNMDKNKNYSLKSNFKNELDLHQRLILLYVEALHVVIIFNIPKIKNLFVNRKTPLVRNS